MRVASKSPIATVRRALCAAAALALLGAAPAAAKTVNLIAYTGNSFDGTGSTAGAFTGGVNEVAINQQSGNVYVMDTGNGGTVSQFNQAGTPLAFSGLSGASSIVMGASGVPDLAVDNSPTSAGNFFAMPEAQPLHAYAASGVEITGNFPLTGLGDNCGMAIDPGGNIWVASYPSELIQFNSSGAATGKSIPTTNPCRLAIDTNGNFYVAQYVGPVRKYNSDGEFQSVLDPNSTNAVAVDPATNNVYVDHGSYVSVYEPSGAPITSFGEAAGSYGGLSNSNGIAINATSGDIYVANSNSGAGKVDIFHPTGDITVPDVTTEAPEVTPTGATLRGVVNADGVDTTECEFEWGPSTDYGNTVPCAEGEVFTGSDDHTVTAQLEGLQQGSEYHYRLVAGNANGVPSNGADRAFKPQGAPVLKNIAVSQVNTDGARLNAEVEPNGGTTSYHFEWGTEDCSTHTCTAIPVPDGQLPSATEPRHVSQTVTGLEPGTTYHFRVEASNENGPTLSEDSTFSTFPAAVQEPDHCANAHVRQQTGAALLLDCRAYELVSDADTGGYDVRSDLVGGQTPFVAQPDARDSVLYSLNFGTIPGISGSPTNFGDDPYVATRGADGWTTRYVGIPSDGTPDPGPFATPVAGVSAGLASFAFGGQGICDPCFGGGTGIPIRTPGGSLIQGMAGSLPGTPDPAGYIARYFSADGEHFFFGSASQFEPAGNDNGDVTIYERDLAAGGTQVISTEPDGSTISGAEVGELGASADGADVVVGKKVSADSAGNVYWHLYMHRGDSSHSVDLTPGSTSGAIFDGMSADGSTVYFTTPDQLSGADSDDSADVYMAKVTGASADLSLLSAGNSSGCDPAPNRNGDHWNALGATANCGALAFAGGAGVAGQGETVYFLSPELLDGAGNGEPDQPNLYVARGEAGPRYVATLEPENPAVRNALANSETHSFADFQVSADGRFAAFASTLPLTGFANLGHAEIFRYDADAESGDGLVCASCATTGASPSTDTTLSGYGLNLSDDGRVFFSSDEPLVLRDTNGEKDAYEWENGRIQVISTGSSSAQSGLLSVSADGVNAYFFTREVLVPEDHNGTAMKIYDAREGGGYPIPPEPVPCQASDECHGPGTEAAPPAKIYTIEGSGGQGKPAKKKGCGRHRVKRHGKCVKRKHSKTKHRKSKKHRKSHSTPRHG